MPRPPSVNVIIPTYNYGRFVTEAIASVERQTVPVDEIIVVDDGSTDDTKERLTDLMARGVIRYIHQSNRGLPAARNTGLRAAGGSYLTFLDADDRWLPGKNATQLACVAAHPEAGLIFSPVQFFRADSIFDRTSFQIIPPASGFALGRLFERNFIHVSSALVKRECLERAGWFDESLRSSEDHDLWLRIARHAPLAYTTTVAVEYRVHAASMSRHLLTLATSQVIVKERYAAQFPEIRAALGPARFGRAMAEAYFDLGLALLINGQVRDGRARLRQALANAPTHWQAMITYLASFAGRRGFESYYRLRARQSRFNRWRGFAER